MLTALDEINIFSFGPIQQFLIIFRVRPVYAEYNSVTIYRNLVIRKLNNRANKVKGRGENTQFSGIIYSHGTTNEPRKSTKYVKKILIHDFL